MCPAGKPEELYFFPPPDFTDCKRVVNLASLQNCEGLITHCGKCNNKDFEAYLDYICVLQGWNLPNDPMSWQDCLSIYLKIRAVVPDSSHLL